MSRTAPRGWFALLLASCVVVSACGPGGTEGEPEAEGEGDTSGGEETGEGGGSTHQSARELIGINPPETPWEEMSHEEREYDMIGRFLPIMQEIFREHDAERYAELGCESCHGSNMRERNFEMPSTELPQIPAPDSERYRALSELNPQVMHFMEQDVTPPMQTMLGMGESFTCNGCHPAGG